MNTIYLSKQGMKDLKKRISKLEHEKRMLELELRKDDTRDDMILQSEIFARIDAIRSEISEKQYSLHNAKLLPKDRKSLKVRLGSFVELLDKTTGRIMKFQIVNSVEANPLAGRISADSPLGKSLLGRKVNEIISWTTGLNNMNMTLVSIG